MVGVRVEAEEVTTTMRAWIEQRAGSSILVRSGEAVVTAVTPVSAQDVGVGISGAQQWPSMAGSTSSLALVEMQCLPHRRPRSIRVTVRAVVGRDSEIAERAMAAEGRDEPVSWLIEWHRRTGIPPQVPIENLHLPTDATAVLVALAHSSELSGQVNDVSVNLS